MPGNSQASVFIGNLDEKVDERVLYEIMIQAGPVVDVYMPRDKESHRHKGYAFAEFSTEASAQYAIDLFSGLVYLHKKPLRFSISGQAKLVQQAASQEESDRGLLDNSIQRSQKSREPVLSPLAGGYNKSYIAGKTLQGSPRVAVHSEYAGVGQRLEFSSLSYAQNYNARLVSLGQAGLQSQRLNVEPTPPYHLY